MVSTATIPYRFNCPGCTPAQMLAFVQAVKLDLTQLQIYGVTVKYDDGGAIIGPGPGLFVRRTIVLNLLQPPTVDVNNPPLHLVGKCPEKYNWTGSIVSSSPRDALEMIKKGNPDCCIPDSTEVGDGVHTVTVTYLDDTGAGPFTEVVTMNGQTRVAMVNGNKSKIISVTNTTTGASGLNIGQLTVFTDPDPLPSCPCPGKDPPGRIVVFVPEGLQYGPDFIPGPPEKCDPVLPPVPPDQAADWVNLFTGQFAMAFPDAPPIAEPVLLA